MPISGIVVSCRPEEASGVAEKLAGNQGIEVHGVLADGKIVAVIEADTIDAEVDLVKGLQQMEGVISVQLAYHNFEDAAPEGAHPAGF
ncbi:chaperone NapD [Geomonas edaphica]|uniref:chaperone NapD n=1 Tax=Geomonas edaphica TaxID=2570226 RepID=UPI0010A7F5E1|nr:chaperone NapD [Geomonas edaphica]